jgi:hypothetical protein
MDSSIGHLLAQTKTILEHQKKAEILRGESFNVFSVLRMESNENKTHSAFLRELLDPNGSHLQGNKFLELFLKTINYNGNLNYKTAIVKVEHSIGNVNYLNKEGGRIDIYIKDRDGNTISIENKIWAGDQVAQIERYVKHNKKKNKVYYLTLHGNEPSQMSKGILKSGTDFYKLSYKEDIKNWLEACLKEAVDIPILRESIKQYIILIKKLTNTMDNKEAEKLAELIFDNYEAAKTIHSNFNSAKNNVNNSLRESVLSKLTLSLGNEFYFHRGNNVDKEYSQIWINPKINDEKGFVPKIRFGLESFSGIGLDEGQMFIGIFIGNQNVDDFLADNEMLKGDEWWLKPTKISNYEGFELKLANPKLLKRILDSDFKERLANHIVKECLVFLNLHKETVLKYLKQ